MSFNKKLWMETRIARSINVLNWICAQACVCPWLSGLQAWQAWQTHPRPLCLLKPGRLSEVSPPASTSQSVACLQRPGRGTDQALSKAILCWKTHSDSPGGPVAKAPHSLPTQEAWVRSLVRELDPTCHNQEFVCHNQVPGQPNKQWNWTKVAPVSLPPDLGSHPGRACDGSPDLPPEQAWPLGAALESDPAALGWPPDLCCGRTVRWSIICPGNPRTLCPSSPGNFVVVVVGGSWGLPDRSVRREKKPESSLHKRLFTKKPSYIWYRLFTHSSLNNYVFLLPGRKKSNKLIIFAVFIQCDWSCTLVLKPFTKCKYQIPLSSFKARTGLLLGSLSPQGANPAARRGRCWLPLGLQSPDGLISAGVLALVSWGHWLSCQMRMSHLSPDPITGTDCFSRDRDPGAASRTRGHLQAHFADMWGLTFGDSAMSTDLPATPHPG